MIDGIPDFRDTTTDGEQKSVFDAYFARPAPTVAIVGSSLAMRLKEEYFSHINVENVALPGGSPLTGLEIIQRSTKRKPRIIAIETNILSRGVDGALAKRYEGSTRPIEVLRPLRTLTALFQPKLALAHRLNSTERETLLRSAPAPMIAAYQKIAAEAVPEYNKPIYDTIIRRDAETLKTLVNKLQAEGVQVYLFEMPVSPEHSQTRLYDTTRSEIFRLFPPEDMLHLDYKLADLHWNDGSHLDERSALIVAGTLENVIAKKIESLAER
jgi:hypothetical protein